MAKVATIIGSLRKDSINRKLALALAELAKPKLDLQILELHDMPMYNQDLEADVPAPVQRLRGEVKAADAVLFVSPEYNRSFTAITKNAVDWASRPYGHNAWRGKPGATIGTSLGAVGTAVSQSALAHVLKILDVHLLGQPEVYLTYKEGLFDEHNNITDEDTKAFLTMFVDRFAAWIDRVKIITPK